jgi:predicted nucleic acid-binding protein
MHLLDTMVISELSRRAPNRHVLAWFASISPNELYLSVVSVSEIERGIERQRQIDPAFAGRLSSWLEGVLRAYGHRVLPLTVAIARRWGRLAAKLGRADLDLAIAATALEHGLTIATRNEGHFAPTGVLTRDPFRA